MPRPIIPQGEIIKGNWLDAPMQNGFSSFPGIYILCTGSNSAYGNYDGGFPSREAAEVFQEDHDLGPEWQIVEHALDDPLQMGGP